MSTNNWLDTPMGQILKGGFGVQKAALSFPFGVMTDAVRNAAVAPIKAGLGVVGAATGLEAPKTPDLGMQNTAQAGGAYAEPIEQMKRGIKDALVNYAGFRPEGYGRGVAKMLPSSNTEAATTPTNAMAARPSGSPSAPSANTGAARGVGGFTGKALGATGANTITVTGEDGSQRVLSVPGNYGVEGGGGSVNMSPIEYQRSIGQGVDNINRYDSQFQDLITSMVDAINRRGRTTTGDPSHDRWLKASIPKALRGAADLLAPMTSQGHYGVAMNQIEENTRHNKVEEAYEGSYKQALARGVEQRTPAEIAKLNAEAAKDKALAAAGKPDTLENIQVKDWDTGFNKYLNDTVFPGLTGAKPEEQKTAIEQARSLYMLANPHPLANKLTDVKENPDGTRTVTFGDGRQTIMKRKAAGGV